jgi:hypothetical protein
LYFAITSAQPRESFIMPPSIAARCAIGCTSASLLTG